MNEGLKIKSSAKKNYVLNLFYQIFLIIVPLITAPYVSKTIGAEGVGKFSFSYSLITYFTIFGSLGFTLYAQREMSKHQGNILKQSILFWEINLCRLIPVFFTLALNLLFCTLNIYKSYTFLMFIMTINILAIAFDESFLFQGNEDFLGLVLPNTIIKSMAIVMVFIFVRTKNDLWIYTLILSLSTFFSSLFIWLMVPKYVCRVSLRTLRPLKHLKGTFVLFIPTIATSVYTILDKTLIGLLVPGTYTEIVNSVEVIKKISDLENGYYEQAEKLVKMLMTIITAIGTIMIPRNTNELSKGNIDRVKYNLRLSSRIVIILGLPMSLGIIAIAPNFVPWFFGQEFNKTISLIQILAPLIVIIGFSNVLGIQYLLPSGSDFKYTIGVSSGAVMNVLLNIFLIRYYKSTGAAVATVCAELFVTIIMSFMCINTVNIYKEIIHSYKSIISSVLMFVIVYYLGNKLYPSVLNTFIITLSGISIYVFLLIMLKERTFISGLNYIKGIINRLKINK